MWSSLTKNDVPWWCQLLDRWQTKSVKLTRTFTVLVLQKWYETSIGLFGLVFGFCLPLILCEALIQYWHSGCYIIHITFLFSLSLIQFCFAFHHLGGRKWHSCKEKIWFEFIIFSIKLRWHLNISLMTNVKKLDLQSFVELWTGESWDL